MKNNLELARIWQHVDKDMHDKTLKNVLLHVGYTQAFHAIFTAVASGDIESDPQKLPWVLKPLKRYYNARLKMTDRELTDHLGEQEKLSGKITLLFADRSNPTLDAARREHTAREQSLAAKAGEFRQTLSDIEWFLADPRFRQDDPALRERSLQF